jgi:hypothetical protein
VAASVELVVVDEVVWIRALGPAPWGLIELVGKDADGERNRDGLGVEEVRLVLPVETSRGNPRVRQPVERDVVEDVVSGQGALQVSLKGLFTSPGWPVPSPWSSMNAARSAGESASPYSVCGRVPMICA